MLGASGAGVASGDSLAAPDERELGLTIYRQEVAAVRDRRRISSPEEPASVRWPGVAPALRPDTVRFEARATEMRAHRVRHRPLSMDALLEANIGKPVQFERNTARGREQVDGRLVSAHPPLVSSEGAVRSVDPDRLIFPDGVPDGLGAEPGLELELASIREGRGGVPDTTPATVGYLTEGLSWSADYVATLNAAGDRLELTARATIANDSGMDIDRAETELVAGAPNVPQGASANPGAERAVMMEDAGRRDTAAAPLGDLQRYRLRRPITLADGQRRSVRLFARRDLPVTRTYALVRDPRGGGRIGAARPGWHPAPVAIRLAWANESGPLPAGAVRVYRRGEGGTRFVGGDRIEDRPAGREVRIEPGRPFDVTARRRQTGFERLGERVHAVSHEIRLHNDGHSRARFRVPEPIPGDWRITEASRDWEKEAAHLAVWQVDVEPGETEEIRYRARIER